jgi:hypothetical protein
VQSQWAVRGATKVGDLAHRATRPQGQRWASATTEVPAICGIDAQAAFYRLGIRTGSSSNICIICSRLSTRGRTDGQDVRSAAGRQRTRVPARDVSHKGKLATQAREVKHLQGALTGGAWLGQRQEARGSEGMVEGGGDGARG